jgi:hypothetical protein
MKNILVAGMILAIGLSSADGQEIFRLSPNSINSLAYDAQSDNPAAVIATIRIKQALAVDFVYALSFEPGSAGRRLAGPDPAYSLGYELLDTAFQPPRILKAWLEGIYPDDFPTGMFPAGTRNTNIEHPFTVIVPAGSIVPAGTYSGSFTLALYGSPVGTTPGLLENRAFPVSVVVPEYTEIGVVQVDAPFFSPSGSQTVDFGQLEDGDQESLDLIVRSNVTYSVSVSSVNGSALLNVDPAEPTPIPYTLNANGASVAMLAGLAVPIISTAPWTAGGEARYRLNFSIGVFDMVAAGDYTDTLTFTVSAN